MTLRVLVPAYALALAIVTCAYANAQIPTRETPASPTIASVQLTWVPEWLMIPLRRAIADANDPRERSRD